MNPVCSVFVVVYANVSVYVYAFYRNPGYDGSLYDCLPDCMARVQSVDDKAVFVFVCSSSSSSRTDHLAHF